MQSGAPKLVPEHFSCVRLECLKSGIRTLVDTGYYYIRASGRWNEIGKILKEGNKRKGECKAGCKKYMSHDEEKGETKTNENSILVIISTVLTVSKFSLVSTFLPAPDFLLILHAANLE